MTTRTEHPFCRYVCMGYGPACKPAECKLLPLRQVDPEPVPEWVTWPKTRCQCGDCEACRR